MFLSHFILSRLLWFGSLFLQAGGLWLHFVVETVLCGWDGSSDLSRFNALWNLCLCSGRWICVSSPWSAMNCSWIVLWGVCGFAMASCIPFNNIHSCVSLLLDNSCGFSCTEYWLECWNGFPCRHGNSGFCVCPLMFRGKEFNVDLKFWNQCPGLLVSLPRLQ